jgi:hypothetical protein
MDTSINVSRLSRELYKRGTHRLLGNPFLGSLAAFLSLLLLIRIAANFYMAIAISNTNPKIDAVQIASAHFVFLSAYAVWVGTLGSCRISLALPRVCSVNFALHGRRFRSKFLRQTAFLRSMNIAYLAMMVLTAFVFSAICGSWRVIAVRGLLALLSTFAAFIIVAAVASRSVPSRSEFQLLEMLYLLFLLVLNPDIGCSNGVVRVCFQGFDYSFSSHWKVGAAVGLIAIRALSGVNNYFGRQIFLSPMQRWYWRFLRIRSWAFLYAVVAPVFVSSAISLSIKRWTLVLSILFAVALYLYFITHCENTLHEKWRCSLFDKGNTRLVIRSVLIHVVLTAIPAIGYIIFQ